MGAQVSSEVRHLIARMARENFFWGVLETQFLLAGPPRGRRAIGLARAIDDRVQGGKSNPSGLCQPI